MERQKVEVLTRGGVYLVKLNPTKKNEASKVRPSVILTSQQILDVDPPVVFICPLSSKSFPAFHDLHVELTIRDNLKVKSFALIEHCRSISVEQLIFPRIAQLTLVELDLILHRLQRMLGN